MFFISLQSHGKYVCTHMVIWYNFTSVLAFDCNTLGSKVISMVIEERVLTDEWQAHRICMKWNMCLSSLLWWNSNIVNFHNLVDRTCKHTVQLEVWLQKFDCPLVTGRGFKSVHMKLWTSRLIELLGGLSFITGLLLEACTSLDIFKKLTIYSKGSELIYAPWSSCQFNRV
jgi:hypothetical protein